MIVEFLESVSPFLDCFQFFENEISSHLPTAQETDENEIIKNPRILFWILAQDQVRNLQNKSSVKSTVACQKWIVFWRSRYRNCFP